MSDGVKRIVVLRVDEIDMLEKEASISVFESTEWAAQKLSTGHTAGSR